MSNKNLQYYKSIEYNIIVKREVVDNEKWYVAYCNEFGVNACHGIGDTREEAIESFLEEKEIFIELLYQRGEIIPEAITEDTSYSGVFSVRTSPWIHSMLVEQAKVNNVSLNAYINQLLAFGAGQEHICHKLESTSNELTKQYYDIKKSLASISYNTGAFNFGIVGENGNNDNKGYKRCA